MKSKYQVPTGVLRARIKSSTRVLMVIGAMPGGALIAFCEPLKQMSMRSRSTSSGIPASDATVSTIKSAPNSSATLRKCSIFCTTPVDVSPCASPINLIFFPLPARRTSSASTVLPTGASTRITLAGLRSAMTAMRSENIPFTQTMHSSPCSSGLSTAASMPPEPDAEIG